MATKSNAAGKALRMPKAVASQKERIQRLEAESEEIGSKCRSALDQLNCDIRHVARASVIAEKAKDAQLAERLRGVVVGLEIARQLVDDLEPFPF